MINGIKEVIVELKTGIVEALVDICKIKEINSVLDSLESKMVGSYKDWEK